MSDASPVRLTMLTRFNDETWAMYKRSVERSLAAGGSPAYNTMVESKQLRASASRGGGGSRADVFVFEMRCDRDRIGGVGRVRFDAERHPLRRWCGEPPARVYGGNYERYNNYAYPIETRVGRSALVAHFGGDWVEDVERALFSGKAHAKRGTGLTQRNPRNPYGRPMTPRRYRGFSLDAALWGDLDEMFAARA